MEYNQSLMYSASVYMQKAKEALRGPFEVRRDFRYIVNNVPYELSLDWAFMPYTIFIAINSQCNARCTMCDIGLQNRESQFFQISNRNRDFDIKKFKELIDEVKSFKPEISMSLTEPLIYPHIIEAVRIVKQAGLKCSIVTNGFLLPKYSDEFCNLGLDTICLSVDGIGEIHNEIRGLPTSFERILEGINKLLKRKKRPKIIINTVITPLNQTYLYDIAHFFNAINIDGHSFSHMSFITEEMVELHNRSCNLYQATERSVAKIDPSKIDINILQDQLARIKEEFRRVTFWPPIFKRGQLSAYYKSGVPLDRSLRCKLPWLVSTITADGDVVGHATCYNVSFGNIHEKSFKEIWNGRKIRQFRRYLLKFGAFPACSRCCGLFR